MNADDDLINNKTPTGILRDYRIIKTWWMIAALAAFIASSFFVVKYFAGGTLDIETWNREQWLNAGLGLLLTAAITACQALLYKSGSTGTAAVATMVVVIFFGMFTETSQSMEREDATVSHRSTESQVFKAAIGAVDSIKNTDPGLAYAGMLAQAEVTLARCKENLRLGKEKHCNGDQQKVDSYQQQQAAARAGNQSQLSGALQQAKALEYDEDKHYAMIRIIRDFLGVLPLTASLIFSVIVIGTFEWAFHYLGTALFKHQKALIALGMSEYDQPQHGSMLTGITTTALNAGNAVRGLAKKKSLAKPVASVSLAKSVPSVSSTPGTLGTPEDVSLKIPTDAPRLVTLLENAKVDPEDTPAVHALIDQHSLTGSKVALQAFAVQFMTSHPTAGTPAGTSDDTEFGLTHEQFDFIYEIVRLDILQGQTKPTVRPVMTLISEIMKRERAVFSKSLSRPVLQKLADYVLICLERETVIHSNPDSGAGRPKYLTMHTG